MTTLKLCILKNKYRVLNNDDIADIIFNHPLERRYRLVYTIGYGNGQHSISIHFLKFKDKNELIQLMKETADFFLNMNR